jgi:hypothetical protein
MNGPNHRHSCPVPWIAGNEWASRHRCYSYITLTDFKRHLFMRKGPGEGERRGRDRSRGKRREAAGRCAIRRIVTPHLSHSFDFVAPPVHHRLLQITENAGPHVGENRNSTVRLRRVAGVTTSCANLEVLRNMSGMHQLATNPNAPYEREGDEFCCRVCCGLVNVSQPRGIGESSW